jgi:hypothetical protein
VAVTKKAGKRPSKTVKNAKVGVLKESSSKGKQAGKKNTSSKANIVETGKKLALKNGAGKGKVEHKGGKQRRIPLPDTVEQKRADKQELDPFEVAKRTMKGSVPAIVKAMVELAKQGSCTHAKTLLEMTGAKRMFDGDSLREDGGEPWAKLVLERLDEAEQKAVQSESALEKALDVGAVVGLDSRLRSGAAEVAATL